MSNLLFAALAGVAFLRPNAVLVAGLGIRHGSVTSSDARRQGVLMPLAESSYASAYQAAMASLLANATAEALDWSVISADALDHMLAFAEADKDYGPDGAGNCLGLKSKTCKPCPPLEFNQCGHTSKQCDKLFCSPLCLQIAWQCEVKATGEFSPLTTVAEKKALCAQMVGWACSKLFKCCKKDKELAHWVEGYAFGAGIALQEGKTKMLAAPKEAFPHPLFPIGACIHDAQDKTAASAACRRCKASLKLKYKATPKRCEFGTSALPHAKGASKKRGGAHHSFEERCEALTKKLKAKLPGAMVKANKMLCKCAGCCNPGKGKDSCYFPVVEYGV